MLVVGVSIRTLNLWLPARRLEGETSNAADHLRARHRAVDAVVPHVFQFPRKSARNRDPPLLFKRACQCASPVLTRPRGRNPSTGLYPPRPDEGHARPGGHGPVARLRHSARHADGSHPPGKRPPRHARLDADQDRVDPATKYRCPWIEGYCSHTSVRAGETVNFLVSTNPPSPFTLDIYRIGYYGGIGGRLMQTLGPFKGVTQPDPPIGPKRVRDCQWEPCASLRDSGRLAERRLPRQAHRRTRGLAELRHLHRAR